MTNHIHVIVRTSQPNLGNGMWLAHGAYARSYNARHGRVNHLFGDRYGASLLREPQHVRRIATYVARNPVEARMCPAPEHWPWSSYPATVGLMTAPAWLDVAALLAHFDGSAEAFARHVAGRAEVSEAEGDTRASAREVPGTPQGG